MKTSLKLTIELIPETSWYNNLRSMMKKEEWDTLRKRVYADYGNKCGICGNPPPLECHEKWEYDDKKYIQKLTGFIALCRLCHAVKHMGLSELRGKAVMKHFMKVNGCDRKTFETERKIAYELFEKRSKHSWTLVIR